MWTGKSRGYLLVSRDASQKDGNTRCGVGACCSSSEGPEVAVTKKCGDVVLPTAPPWLSLTSSTSLQVSFLCHVIVMNNNSQCWYHYLHGRTQDSADHCRSVKTENVFLGLRGCWFSYSQTQSANSAVMTRSNVILFSSSVFIWCLLNKNYLIN